MDDRTEIGRGEEGSFVNPRPDLDRTRLTVPLVANRPAEFDQIVTAGLVSDFKTRYLCGYPH